MSLSKDDLLHLAKLSRLTIEEEKLDLFRVQLDGILGYVSRLQMVNVEHQADQAMTQEAVVRMDHVEASSSELLEALRTEFPDRVDHLLRVPGVFEKPKD